LEIYPSIPTAVFKTPILAFDKLDGSNIRVEWARKSGFSKFGTRKRLLDPNEDVLGEAVSIFQAKYADELEKVFRKQRFEKTTVFLEFGGANSFAGQHLDEEHDLVLFDAHVYKKGLLTGKEFLKLFGHLHTPEVLYEGSVNQPLIDAVRDSTLDGMTFEGVVCKGGYDNRGRPIMFKLKSQAWLDAVKAKYGHNAKLLEELI
jgi:hypothetical protein